MVQRRFELAVRIALGADARSLSRGVLAEGLALARLGAALGTAGAMGLSELIRGLLFGVEPTDLATTSAVIATSLLAAAVASYWPARRTTRIDPVEVLRVE